MNSTDVEHRLGRHDEEGTGVRAIAIKEFRELRRDRRTLAMLFLLPFLFLVVFGYAASFDIKDAPTVIVGPGAQAVAAVLSAPFDVAATDAGGDKAAAQDGLRRGEAVRDALCAGGVSALLTLVPATIEETFVRLALAQQDSIATDLERTTQ
jgi:ABC-type Na+ efflux pump permease subunit